MLPATAFFDIPARENVPAHRVAYMEWGNPQSTRTLVCVHGLTRNARDFDFLAQALTPDFRVLCLDMAGRGQSEYLSAPAAYHYGTYVVDCLQWLQHMKLTRVHWLGTSMGGIIGMMLAGFAPAMFASLTLNDIGCLIPAAALKRILSYAGVNTTFSSRAEAKAALRINCAPFGIRDETHWQHLFAHSLITEAGGITRLAYDPAITVNFPPADKIEDTNLWNLWEPVKTIPTLLLRGAQSDILPREIALEMQSKHPALTYHEIVNTGHAPALMEPSQIALVKDFLK